MKSLIDFVVFTFQKEGRCNFYNMDFNDGFVVFTFQKEGRCNVRETLRKFHELFLPFKKKADATALWVDCASL